MRVTTIRETADPARVPDFLTVGEAAAVLRIGRTAAYDLAREYLATGGEAEIVDVADEVMAEFCTRSVDVEDRVAVKLDRFVDTVGREPTPRERWRIEREAVIDSRPAKTTGVDAAGLHARWRAQVEALGVDPDTVVAGAVGRVERVDVLANEVVPVGEAAFARRGSSSIPLTRCCSGCGKATGRDRWSRSVRCSLGASRRAPGGIGTVRGPDFARRVRRRRCPPR